MTLEANEINGQLVFKNLQDFNSKLQNFSNSYKINKKKLAFLLDFDFTITKLYNYQTKQNLLSSYRFYDEGLIGGDQEKLLKIQNDLTNTYSKYEHDISIDIEIRKEKVYEYYAKSLDCYMKPTFTRDKVGVMLEKLKDKYELRKYTKEFFEILLEMEIPIIIVSAGVKQVIEDLLIKIIPEIEKFVEQKKINIIANDLIFDKDKGCVGYSKDIIYTFNKSSFVREIMKKYFQEYEKVFIAGDHLNDYDCVHELDLPKESVIGFGFLNIKPDDLDNKDKEEEKNKKIELYKNIYDAVLVGDADFQFLVESLKKIKDDKI